MVHFTVSDEDARLITEASTPVIVVDRSGRRLGQIMPVDVENTSAASISPDELAEVKRRVAKDDGTRYTWAEIKEYLHTLPAE